MKKVIKEQEEQLFYKNKTIDNAIEKKENERKEKN